MMTAALGPALVYPLNVEWLMRGDFSVHFFGWHLYRSGPWTLPLGATPHLMWPMGGSVGLTDSIPMASVVFKLFDSLLPPVFQFIGMWLVLSFFLQGVFGALLMQLATPRPALQWLGAMLFVLSPPLIIRFGHPALTAHWLLLAALWLALKADAPRVSLGRALAWAGVGAMTAAVQPYLLPMVLTIAGAVSLRQCLAAPRQVLAIALHGTLVLAAVWMALWQSGSLMVPGADGLTIGGFGAYSANLLTFIMPTESQTLLAPGLIGYASPSQYEGYSYLGAGVLLLGAIVAGSLVASPRPAAWWAAARPHLPLLAGLLVMAAMAVGPVVTAGPRTLLTYDSQWWGPLTAFRSNGRMIWALHYAVVTVIAFAATRFAPRTALALLGLAVAVQAMDVAGMSRDVKSAGDYGFRDPLESRFWTVAPPHYERLVLVPPNLCDRDGAVNYRAFALVAGRHGLALNAGGASRHDTRRTAEYLRGAAAGDPRRPGHAGIALCGAARSVANARARRCATRPDLCGRGWIWRVLLERELRAVAARVRGAGRRTARPIADALTAGTAVVACPRLRLIWLTTCTEAPTRRATRCIRATTVLAGGAAAVPDTACRCAGADDGDAARRRGDRQGHARPCPIDLRRVGCLLVDASAGRGTGVRLPS